MEGSTVEIEPIKQIKNYFLNSVSYVACIERIALLKIQSITNILAMNYETSIYWIWSSCHSIISLSDTNFLCGLGNCLIAYSVFNASFLTQHQSSKLAQNWAFAFKGFCTFTSLMLFKSAFLNYSLHRNKVRSWQLRDHFYTQPRIFL